MPVVQNSQTKTVRFTYQHEGNAEFKLDVEYYHTEEFGPSVIIHNLEGGPITLPFSAFTDTVEVVTQETTAVPPVSVRSSAMKPTTPRSAGGSRLAPTRVSAGRSPSQPGLQPQGEEIDLGGPEEVDRSMFSQNGQYYGNQTDFMVSPGAIESFSVRQPPNHRQMPQQPPAQQAPRSGGEPPLNLGGDAAFPQELSLRAGRAMRAAAQQSGSPAEKRISRRG